MKKNNLDIKKIRETVLLSSGKVWGITSIKETVGKSFVSGELVAELNKIGKKVLSLSIGEQNTAENFCIFKGVNQEIELLSTDNVEETKYVCMNDLGLIESIVFDDRFSVLMDAYKEKYDYIIIDVPAIEATGISKRICKMCDENIIVVMKNKENGSVVGDKICQLQKLDIKIAGVVLNEYNPGFPLLRM